mmetsp:Transcript_42948/g.122808  ORF Transcript_42948/g.122808 Transcript_42948/m.122808 type:complete len:248 (+) Transcript_42948:2036-2779(+)
MRAFHLQAGRDRGALHRPWAEVCGGDPNRLLQAPAPSGQHRGRQGHLRPRHVGLRHGDRRLLPRPPGRGHVVPTVPGSGSAVAWTRALRCHLRRAAAPRLRHRPRRPRALGGRRRRGRGRGRRPAPHLALQAGREQACRIHRGVGLGEVDALLEGAEPAAAFDLRLRDAAKVPGVESSSGHAVARRRERGRCRKCAGEGRLEKTGLALLWPLSLRDAEQHARRNVDASHGFGSAQGANIRHLCNGRA